MNCARQNGESRHVSRALPRAALRKAMCGALNTPCVDVKFSILPIGDESAPEISRIVGDQFGDYAHRLAEKLYKATDQRENPP
jgi:hypothetical protein